LITPAATASLSRNGLGWYLYGVAAADEASVRLEAGLAAGAEQEVELVAEGPLVGVASRVSLQEFDEPALPERLRDATWLEEKIRAHQQVLERVLEDASVVPCRFCTVYRSEVELRRFLSQRREVLQAALDRVRGKVEVGVKAFIDRDRFASAQAKQNDDIRQLENQVSAAEGGRAYLEGRRLEQRVASELEGFRGEAAGRLHARLLAAAEDGLALPLQAPELSGREEEMVFNGAYLVTVDRVAFEEALASLGRDLRDDGVDLELTGPWPPYNFVPEELGAE
jgi:Gas vesicle synthesis protein GvpL/GvpF